jgi:ABC-type uncharacterized transport system ATPase subunit
MIRGRLVDQSDAANIAASLRSTRPDRARRRPQISRNEIEGRAFARAAVGVIGPNGAGKTTLMRVTPWIGIPLGIASQRQCRADSRTYVRFIIVSHLLEF